MSDVDLTRLGEWVSQNMRYTDNDCQYSNCLLTPITTRSARSRFSYGFDRIALPLGVSLDVYSFPIVVTRGVKAIVDGWIDGITLMNSHGIRMIVYDAFGRVVPLGGIYVLYRDCQVGFVAINHAVSTACTTSTGRANGMYLTYQHVGSLGNVQSNVGPNATDTAGSVYAGVEGLFLAYDNTTISSGVSLELWVNGQWIGNPTSYTPKDTDYVENYVTQNTLPGFTVNVDDNTTGYQSTFYASYREILHLPVANNPQQLILPHDVLSIVVYDTQTKIGQLYSRYSSQSVRQITHQDWSIDRTEIEAIKTSLGSTNVSVQVIVGTPVKTMTQIEDVSYITDLYRNDDATILQFLQGSGDPNLPFWKAANLEQSQWLSLLFTGGSRLYPEPGANGQNLPIPSVVDNTPDANYYVSALGYYHTATILSSGIRQTTWYDGFFSLVLPRSLMGRNVYSYIFNNGRKILDSLVTTTVLTSQVNVSLASSAWKTGDTIQSIVKDAGGGVPEQWSVSATATTMTVADTNFSIYAVSTVNGSTTYTQVSRGQGTWMLTQNTDGSYLITAYPAAYGQTWLYYPSSVSSSGVVSLDNSLAALDALWFSIETDNGYPLLTIDSLDVFLNGYWLVEGIDYVQDTSGTGTRIIITNRNFLDITATGNVVEWYACSETMVSDDIGYLDNGILTPGDSFLVQETLSELYVEGLLVTDGVDKGVYLEVPNQSAGSVCELSLGYPTTVLDSLPASAKEIDDARRATITKFFQNLIPASTAIAQTTQHQVYSPWLQYVIQQVTTGAMTPVNDPSDTNFIRQFPDAYNLKDYDPTLTDGNAINRQFVAVSAAYTMDVSQTPATVQAMIQRLIKLTLNRAPVAIGVIPT